MVILNLMLLSFTKCCPPKIHTQSWSHTESELAKDLKYFSTVPLDHLNPTVSEALVHWKNKEFYLQMVGELNYCESYQ